MILLLWLACNDAPPVECVDDADCEASQACLGGTCFAVKCTDSVHCPIQHRCNDRHRCVPGCATDNDCLAGDVCLENTCVLAECDTTEVDCSVGEFCVEGTCADVAGPLCQTCDPDCPDGWACMEMLGDFCRSHDDCTSGQCRVFPIPDFCTQDAECPTDAICVNQQCQYQVCAERLCLLECELSDPLCPGGFQCQELQNGGAVCTADCLYLTEQGYL